MRPSSGLIIARLAEKGAGAQRARPFAWRLLDQDQRPHQSEGLPIGVVITPGQAHDVTAFPVLMQEIDCDPDQMLGDKGYDSEAVRDEIQQRGGEAAIPSTA